MIDAAKEIIELVKTMPDYALWILLGILFYKVFIAGSWIMVVRLLIIKIHDFLTRPTIVQHEMCGNPIDEKVRNDLDTVLYAVRKRGNDKHFVTTSYFHQSDVEWLRNVVYAQIRKEEEENKKDEPHP